MSLDNLHNEKRCAIKHLKGYKPFSLPLIHFNTLQYNSINFNKPQLTSIDSILLNAFKPIAINKISK